MRHLCLARLRTNALSLSRKLMLGTTHIRATLWILLPFFFSSVLLVFVFFLILFFMWILWLRNSLLLYALQRYSVLKKKKENGKRNKSQITQRRRVQSKWTNKAHGVFFFFCLACLTNSMPHFVIEGGGKGKKKSWLLL